MQIQHKIIQGMLGLTLITMGVSCTKGFEDLNKPYKDVSVSTASPAGIFNNLARRATDEDYTLYTGLFMPITNQMGTQNVAINITNYTSSYWNNYYPDLADYKQLLKLIDASPSPESYTNVQSMATILIGYKTLQMLDRYGSIPYSQAGVASEGPEMYRPAYDDQATVYKSVLADLATAVSSMKTGAAASSQVALGTYESFLNSDYDAWVKFGNAIRLRYAVRLYAKEQQLASSIITDIIGGNKPLANDISYGNNQINMRKNNVGIYPTLLAAGSIPGSWGDRFFYAFRETSVSSIRLSDNLWNQISATNADDGSGIYDPRSYVWFMPNNAGKWVPQKQDRSELEGGTNIYPNADAPLAPNSFPDNKFAGFNWYLIRDWEQFPYVLISEADVHFLKAEIYAKGMGVAVDWVKAEAEYKAGLTSSINYWYSYAASNTGGIWPTGSRPTLGPTTIATFLAHPKVAFIPADHAGNLQKIITQAWLAAIFEAPEAWAIVRRTGMTPTTTAAATQYNKMPYPADEATNNRENWMNASGGADPGAEMMKKVYWMP
ncbi:SusD/RagB family nutrient-binding outer membrane lipoprotein [Sphingobacterium lumbrici]|uniref:SusD/RagB family nutrient-binding outer membrane lipoprotein n=1 Tax=Sphingobacterium lumbrici TaxID=2559600 RepID=UPI001126E4BF|nr:SusD/RagB family nutrient-binding outer membrane lipoprotein [Sphingobacterium lumbrici]